jgi:hypothetical protein
MATSMKCPSCGLLQLAGRTCKSCGTILGPNPAVSAPEPRRDATRDTRRKALFSKHPGVLTVVVLGIFVLGGVYLFRGRSTPESNRPVRQIVAPTTQDEKTTNSPAEVKQDAQAAAPQAEEQAARNQTATNPPDTLDGWNRARWGMTEDEVLAAFGGEARRLATTEDYDFTARGQRKYFSSIGIDTLQIGSVKCSVRFLFFVDTRTLAYVLIRSKTTVNQLIAEGDFTRLEKMLTEKYGPRTYGSEDRRRDGLGSTIDRQATWAMPKTKIELRFLYMEGIITDVVLSYQPVAATKSERDKI